MVIFLASCIKEPNFAPLSKEDTENLTAAPAKITPPPNCNGLIDSMPAVNSDGDSTEVATIIGAQHVNPYLIPNMQQAYANLGITNVNVAVTNLYVRFLPNSPEQFSILDSTLDEQGLELYDAPMDYDILQEGDYYQDPSISMEDVTYQYSVVPPSFQFPPSIAYTILAQIHIPGDSYTAVETEAERLATLQDCNGNPPNGPDCGIDCHYDYSILQCVCCPPGTTWNGTECIPQCQPGYYWNGTACVPVPPPAPAADAAVPAGNITVSDINLGTTPGVRNVRVVAKRWFKIERTYTDNNGHFQFTKRFKHKVKIRVKFKNNHAAIKVFRLTQFWKMLYPVTKTIGVFSGNKSNIPYNFIKYNTSVADKGNIYWAAATVSNSVLEYKDYALQQNIALPPNHLKIFITRYANGSGLTPMWNKRWFSGLPQEITITFFASLIFLPAGGVSAYAVVLKHEVDMAVSYRGPTSDYTSMFSDNLKTTAYHELTHAAQYAALGNNWYSNFVDAEISETINHFIFNTEFLPYGNGTNANKSPVIALGESWAYHIGQFFADMQYGNSSTCSGEQAICYNNNFIQNLSSHLVSLENFDPNLSTYPFKWIPKGLFYDLIDARNDLTAIPSFLNINDQVAGYTNQQFFNAFSSSITTLGAYRQNLLQQNPNNQTVQLTNLFQQYGY